MAAPQIGRTDTDGQAWMIEGSRLFHEAIAQLSEDECTHASLLPGWTRKHLIAHVAANAEALVNLTHWAATGEEAPMYASPDERAAGIARGAEMSRDELVTWSIKADERLQQAMSSLTDRHWQFKVLTAQGRAVPATETPWMRSREVMVHSVDLDVGITFADLPPGFLVALVEDIRRKRQLDAATLPADRLPQVAAWLAGRPHTLHNAPQIGAWL